MSSAGRALLLVLLWQAGAGAQEPMLGSALPPLRSWFPAGLASSAVAPAPGKPGNRVLSSRTETAERAPARPSRLGPRLFWSAGVALAAGGTAWWSGRRADRAYGRYLHSASLVRQQDQLRRARQYDRVAGAAFALMETGIVFTTYLVFF